MSTPSPTVNNQAPPPHNGIIHPRSSSMFDFTKRKRWIDLAMVDVVGALVFVIKPTAKVLYCHFTGLDEVLGWAESDFLDCDFTDFIDPVDHKYFHSGLSECLRSGERTAIYCRLKPNHDPNALPNESCVEDTLYKFQAVPVAYYGQDQLIFLTGTAACLEGISEKDSVASIPQLRQSISVLDERLRYLRVQLAAEGGLEELAAALTSENVSASAFSSSDLTSFKLESEDGYQVKGELREDAAGAPSQPSGVRVDEEPAEEGEKKKSKKAAGAEAYVCITCGKTDSPEWRKGPLGPKTLCNACGLSWAKRVKKTDNLVGEKETRSTPDSSNNSPSSS